MLAATRAATRRRFSISARRSMIGTAHNSPSCSVLTVWYEAMKRVSEPRPSLLSPWATAFSARS
jgi:hypothetical protein